MIEQLEVSAITEGARLAGVLPYLQEALSKLEKAVDNRVYSAIAKNALTPEVAMYAWQEKHVLTKLRKTFEQKVRIGTTVAENNAEALEWR